MVPSGLEGAVAELRGRAGAYILVIDLEAPLPLALAALPETVLSAGRYAYCGSAYGPGGLGARVRRHLRPGKAARWHVDRLTGTGRIAAVGIEAGGKECDLFARLSALPGTSVPVPGFGSSDCRRCAAHLAAVPAAFDAGAVTPLTFWAPA